MTFQESETLELKEIVVEDIKKEIIAFANSAGGTLYVGVADDGGIVGVENPDTVIQQISNMVRDSIKPDITMFIRYTAKNVEGKQIVAVEIQRGTGRPYYLAKKGLRPEGVYVRQGTSSVPATSTAIRRMIKDTDGDSFEAMRSLEQNLTFQAAEKEFALRDLAFGVSQMKTLGILNTDGIYTNLGLLLSEQCAHTVKAAVFEGTNQSIFRDRQEFTGSLLQQMNEVYEYIDRRNQVHSTFDKLRRIDTRDYPEVAIREALLNSLVHRDYSFSASTLISVYDDRIEFTSIGGLPAGVSLDDIMLGLSVCRNPKLANVFYRLELIEAYGTGMKKIMGVYENSNKKPVIETTDNAFKIILPNLNEDVGSLPVADAGSEAERQVLEFIQKNGSISRKETETAVNLKQTAAGRLLSKMIQKKLIVQIGQGKNTKYRLP
ncbi:putative DNA binding domain-containing protein [Pseudoflavonifractor phocaeensis]|uniref:RNA-binding domain-containing protein n=1 Tax=Pseudoflavonifractor phocaeensis TaxID=1870988 RepID=UPI0025A3DF56|nr:RNA-binding domain-containing protein [Pseudoflavonifractor phocaeensis]MDM8238902.1 putative DNA binding domain-containing protein [Pseudoflavonifractor phocaeensis]